MGKVLWISAVVLVLLVGVGIVASNEGNPPPMLLNPSEPLVDEGLATYFMTKGSIRRADDSASSTSLSAALKEGVAAE